MHNTPDEPHVASMLPSATTEVAATAPTIKLVIVEVVSKRRKFMWHSLEIEDTLVSRVGDLGKRPVEVWAGLPQGVVNVSTARATASTASSRPGRPTICMPMGSPASGPDSKRPHGTDTIGSGDARFHTEVMSSL